MLVFSLVLTAILLGVTVAMARRPPEPVGWGGFLLTGIGVSLAPTCLVFFPPVFLSFVLLGVALGIWTAGRSRLRRFWPMGVSAVTAAYLGMGVITLLGEAPYGRYRQAYPFESMVERVPEPSAERPAMTEATRDRLDELEVRVEIEATRFGSRFTRENALRELHEDRVREFVSAPGFGIARLPSPTYWLRPRPRGATPEQESEWPSTAHEAVPESTPIPDASQALSHFHRDGLLDFLNVPGFGYVKDRTRVAGFQPHGFTRAPAVGSPWKVDRIELVSLLIHAEPTVYMTVTLPTMEGVREFPTRPLDDFEASGLKLLRAGDDMTSVTGPNTLRAFGSIRSTKQCVSCHGGRRGDLLGAFSYTLRRGAEKMP